ncbi:MAG: hypothetical protein MJA32_12655 [Proteobacteria bacterium]|nr:hypothetical protein [Pseudomonadota bacterium]
MRLSKLFVLGLCLAMPGVAAAGSSGRADWYFHVDLDRMRSEPAGRGVYAWLEDEVFDDIGRDAGVDFGAELDSITALSVRERGAIVVMNGDFSQDSKDKLMVFLAAEGDISPLKSSGKSYFRLGEGERQVTLDDARIHYDLAPEDNAWVSFDVRGKILVTSSEDQMKALLAKNGKTPGVDANGGALLVLSAEKTLLQASMDGGLLGHNGASDWDSNILRNAEQVAFLLAAKAGKIALEATLVTEDREIAESLASVARGLISLVSFDGSMDPEAAAMLQSMKIDVTGNALSLSLAVDPDLVVRTLSE